MYELTGSWLPLSLRCSARCWCWSSAGADRGRLVIGTETRRLLLLVLIAQAGVAGALVFADGLAPILALTALLGAGAAVAGLAEASPLPATVLQEALAKANGWV